MARKTYVSMTEMAKRYGYTLNALSRAGVRRTALLIILLVFQKTKALYGLFRTN
jgi:hypothetical protein